MVVLVLEQVLEGQVRRAYGLIQVVGGRQNDFEGPIFRTSLKVKETGLQHIEKLATFQ